MLEPWPKPAAKAGGPEASMAVTLEIVSAIRTLRHETGIEPAETVTVAARAEATADPAALAESLKLGYVETLCKAKLSVMGAGDAPPSPHVTIHIPGYSLFLALPKPADPAAEKARLEKERDALTGLLGKRKATMANADFIAKAPPALVAESRAAIADFEARLARLSERLAQL
jgi:valyl-tRNA synthetase